jgi:hypothetical protein
MSLREKRRTRKKVKIPKDADLIEEKWNIWAREAERKEKSAA